MHPGTKAEPVLVAWGVDVAGKPHLLGLEPGSSESTDAWAGFLRGMLARGLRPPLLVISDGGPGLIAAVEIVLDGSLRQRCLIHRARNLLAKVPKHAQKEVKAEYWAIFDGIEEAPGDRAVAEATRRAKSFSAKWGKLYPAAVECLNDGFDHLTTYLRFPTEHWKRIRHSNFISVNRPRGGRSRVRPLASELNVRGGNQTALEQGHREGGGGASGGADGPRAPSGRIGAGR